MKKPLGPYRVWPAPAPGATAESLKASVNQTAEEWPGRNSVADWFGQSLPSLGNLKPVCSRRVITVVRLLPCAPRRHPGLTPTLPAPLPHSVLSPALLHLPGAQLPASLGAASSHCPFLIVPFPEHHHLPSKCPSSPLPHPRVTKSYPFSLLPMTLPCVPVPCPAVVLGCSPSSQHHQPVSSPL